MIIVAMYEEECPFYARRHRITRRPSPIHIPVESSRCVTGCLGDRTDRKLIDNVTLRSSMRGLVDSHALRQFMSLPARYGEVPRGQSAWLAMSRTDSRFDRTRT